MGLDHVEAHAPYDVAYGGRPEDVFDRRTDGALAITPVDYDEDPRHRDTCPGAGGDSQLQVDLVYQAAFPAGFVEFLRPCGRVQLALLETNGVPFLVSAAWARSIDPEAGREPAWGPGRGPSTGGLTGDLTRDSIFPWPDKRRRAGERPPTGPGGRR